MVSAGNEIQDNANCKEMKYDSSKQSPEPKKLISNVQEITQISSESSVCGEKEEAQDNINCTERLSKQNADITNQKNSSHKTTNISSAKPSVSTVNETQDDINCEEHKSKQDPDADKHNNSHLPVLSTHKAEPNENDSSTLVIAQPIAQTVVQPIAHSPEIKPAARNFHSFQTDDLRDADGSKNSPAQTKRLAQNKPPQGEKEDAEYEHQGLGHEMKNDDVQQKDQPEIKLDNPLAQNENAKAQGEKHHGPRFKMKADNHVSGRKIHPDQPLAQNDDAKGQTPKAHDSGFKMNDDNTQGREKQQDQSTAQNTKGQTQQIHSHGFKIEGDNHVAEPEITEIGQTQPGVMSPSETLEVTHSDREVASQMSDVVQDDKRNGPETPEATFSLSSMEHKNVNQTREESNLAPQISDVAPDRDRNDHEMLSTFTLTSLRSKNINEAQESLDTENEGMSKADGTHYPSCLRRTDVPDDNSGHCMYKMDIGGQVGKHEGLQESTKDIGRQGEKGEQAVRQVVARKNDDNSQIMDTNTEGDVCTDIHEQVKEDKRDEYAKADDKVTAESTQQMSVPIKDVGQDTKVREEKKNQQTKDMALPVSSKEKHESERECGKEKIVTQTKQVLEGITSKSAEKHRVTYEEQGQDKVKIISKPLPDTQKASSSEQQGAGATQVILQERKQIIVKEKQISATEVPVVAAKPTCAAKKQASTSNATEKPSASDKTTAAERSSAVTEKLASTSLAAAKPTNVVAKPTNIVTEKLTVIVTQEPADNTEKPDITITQKPASNNTMTSDIMATQKQVNIKNKDSSMVKNPAAQKSTSTVVKKPPISAAMKPAAPAIEKPPTFAKKPANSAIENPSYTTEKPPVIITEKPPSPTIEKPSCRVLMKPCCTAEKRTNTKTEQPLSPFIEKPSHSAHTNNESKLLVNNSNNSTEKPITQSVVKRPVPIINKPVNYRDSVKPISNNEKPIGVSEKVQRDTDKQSVQRKGVKSDMRSISTEMKSVAPVTVILKLNHTSEEPDHNEKTAAPIQKQIKVIDRPSCGMIKTTHNIKKPIPVMGKPVIAKPLSEKTMTEPRKTITMTEKYGSVFEKPKTETKAENSCRKPIAVAQQGKLEPDISDQKSELETKNLPIIQKQVSTEEKPEIQEPTISFEIPVHTFEKPQLETKRQIVMQKPHEKQNVEAKKMTETICIPEKPKLEIKEAVFSPQKPISASQNPRSVTETSDKNMTSHSIEQNSYPVKQTTHMPPGEDEQNTTSQRTARQTNAFTGREKTVCSEDAIRADLGVTEDLRVEEQNDLILDSNQIHETQTLEDKNVALLEKEMDTLAQELRQLEGTVREGKFEDAKFKETMNEKKCEDEEFLETDEANFVDVKWTMQRGRSNAKDEKFVVEQNTGACKNDKMEFDAMEQKINAHETHVKKSNTDLEFDIDISIVEKEIENIIHSPRNIVTLDNSLSAPREHNIHKPETSEINNCKSTAPKLDQQKSTLKLDTNEQRSPGDNQFVIEAIIQSNPDTKLDPRREQWPPGDQASPVKASPPNDLDTECFVSVSAEKDEVSNRSHGNGGGTRYNPSVTETNRTSNLSMQCYPSIMTQEDEKYMRGSDNSAEIWKSDRSADTLKDKRESPKHEGINPSSQGERRSKTSKPLGQLSHSLTSRKQDHKSHNVTRGRQDQELNFVLIGGSTTQGDEIQSTLGERQHKVQNITSAEPDVTIMVDIGCRKTYDNQGHHDSYRAGAGETINFRVEEKSRNITGSIRDAETVQAHRKETGNKIEVHSGNIITEDLNMKNTATKIENDGSIKKASAMKSTYSDSNLQASENNKDQEKTHSSNKNNEKFELSEEKPPRSRLRLQRLRRPKSLDSGIDMAQFELDLIHRLMAEHNRILYGPKQIKLQQKETKDANKSAMATVNQSNEIQTQKSHDCDVIPQNGVLIHEGKTITHGLENKSSEMSRVIGEAEMLSPVPATWIKARPFAPPEFAKPPVPKYNTKLIPCPPRNICTGLLDPHSQMKLEETLQLHIRKGPIFSDLETQDSFKKDLARKSMLRPKSACGSYAKGPDKTDGPVRFERERYRRQRNHILDEAARAEKRLQQSRKKEPLDPDKDVDFDELEQIFEQELQRLQSCSVEDCLSKKEDSPTFPRKVFSSPVSHLGALCQGVDLEFEGAVQVNTNQNHSGDGLSDIRSDLHETRLMLERMLKRDTEVMPPARSRYDAKPEPISGRAHGRYDVMTDSGFYDKKEGSRVDWRNVKESDIW